MSKLYYLIALFATLCLSSAYAQTESRVLSIEDLFRLADENNRSMRAYSTATAEARENVKSAKKACLPSIDASLSVNYNGNGTITDRNFANAFAAPIPHFGNNFAIEVSQVVFSGGAISSGVKIAELKQQIAVLNAEKNRQEVRFLIAGNYLELCKMQNQLQVFESNIAQTKKVLDNMHSKVNEGVALNNDITRYELQLQNLNYNKIQLENSLLLLNNQLTVATGLPQTVIIVPDTAFVKTLQATSLRQKPDHSAALSLQMAEKTEKIISQAEKIVHAERLPQIALFAGDYLNGPITIEIPAINKNFNYWAIGVGVKYSFGNLYKSNAKIRSAGLATKRAGEEKAVAEEQISLAIDDAFTHYREAFTLLETQQKSVELALQNYAVTLNRYQNGIALLTDMLDASNAKLTAELQLANTKISTVFNYYRLLYLSGIL